VREDGAHPRAGRGWRGLNVGGRDDPAADRRRSDVRHTDRGRAVMEHVAADHVDAEVSTAVAVPRRGRRGWVGAQPPRSQIVARHPNLAVLLTHCGQLILGKISKFDATRCQMFRLKCTKFDFRWTWPQTLLGEPTALPQTS